MQKVLTAHNNFITQHLCVVIQGLGHKPQFQTQINGLHVMPFNATHLNHLYRTNYINIISIGYKYCDHLV